MFSIFKRKPQYEKVIDKEFSNNNLELDNSLSFFTPFLI